MDHYNKYCTHHIKEDCTIQIEHIKNIVRFEQIHNTAKQSSNLQSSMNLLNICVNNYKLYGVLPLSQCVQSL